MDAVIRSIWKTPRTRAGSQPEYARSLACQSVSSSDHRNCQETSGGGLSSFSSCDLRCTWFVTAARRSNRHSSDLLKPPLCCQYSSMESTGPSEDPLLAPASPQPDFALIYSFLGSLFDRSCDSLRHTEVLEQMREIDREIATLLMQNVINNLQHPKAWQEHVQMLQRTALHREFMHAGKSSPNEQHQPGQQVITAHACHPA
ncbi:hypothetical protein WJX84_005384 [Apatococcus fuscideae]|uniref:Uncharacterized protein n=1 Tax=Apatococcus fuscideae TaxID=2026836 RepID=A0AAW1RN16_9CHLO